MASNKRRRHTPDPIIRKLAEGNKLLGSGQELNEVCRRLEIAESTWLRWLVQYGGIKANEAKRLKPHRPGACRRAGGTDTNPCLEAPLCRRRCARSTPVLVGLVSAAGRRRYRHRCASFADPPQRHDWGTGLPTLLLTRSRCHYAPWWPWPGSAGASKNPFKPPKDSSASISTRSGAGNPGTAGPSWPCSLTPS